MFSRPLSSLESGEDHVEITGVPDGASRKKVASASGEMPVIACSASLEIRPSAIRRLSSSAGFEVCVMWSVLSS